MLALFSAPTATGGRGPTAPGRGTVPRDRQSGRAEPDPPVLTSAIPSIVPQSRRTAETAQGAGRNRAGRGTVPRDRQSGRAEPDPPVLSLRDYLHQNAKPQRTTETTQRLGATAPGGTRSP